MRTTKEDAKIPISGEESVVAAWEQIGLTIKTRAAQLCILTRSLKKNKNYTVTQDERMR